MKNISPNIQKSQHLYYKLNLDTLLVLSLLKTHTVREVEAVLRELIEDEETARSILAKCHGFIQATA